jgi:hypothetical protein
MTYDPLKHRPDQKRDWHATVLTVLLFCFIYAVYLLLGGCAATSSAGYQGMSVEQISALAKMKDANINCVIINSPWGKGVTIFVNVDKGVVPSGTVTVDSECKVILTNETVKK